MAAPFSEDMTFCCLQHAAPHATPLLLTVHQHNRTLHTRPPSDTGILPRGIPLITACSDAVCFQGSQGVYCSDAVVTLLIAFAGAHVPYRTASLRLRGSLVNVPAAMQCVCKCSTRARCLLQRCSGHTCSSPRPRACELADVLPLALEHQPYPTLASSAAMQTHQRVGCDQPPHPDRHLSPLLLLLLAPSLTSLTSPHAPQELTPTHPRKLHQVPPQAPTSPPRTLPAQAQDTPQHPNTPLLHASRTSPYQLACTSRQLDQQDSPNSASTPHSSTSSRFPTFVLSVFRAPQAMKSWMSNKLNCN